MYADNSNNKGVLLPLILDAVFDMLELMAANRERDTVVIDFPISPSKRSFLCHSSPRLLQRHRARNAGLARWAAAVEQTGGISRTQARQRATKTCSASERTWKTQSLCCTGRKLERNSSVYKVILAVTWLHTRLGQSAVWCVGGLDLALRPTWLVATFVNIRALCLYTGVATHIATLLYGLAAICCNALETGLLGLSACERQMVAGRKCDSRKCARRR